jgi:DNA transformation protein
MSSYLTLVIEKLSALGSVISKSMFGADAIYHEDVIIGMVSNDVLYFKTGPNNQADYEQAGMKAFTYENKDGKSVSMSYWQVPGDVFESPEKLIEWAKKAHEAAIAAKESSKPKSEKPKSVVAKPEKAEVPKVEASAKSKAKPKAKAKPKSKSKPKAKPKSKKKPVAKKKSKPKVKSKKKPAAKKKVAKKKTGAKKKKR